MAIPQSLATVQSRDAFKFDKQTGFIDECPLHEHINTKQIKFDQGSTANYKGYNASWSIIDNKLCLEKFTAAIKGEAITIEKLFPKSTSPIVASWYTGPIHIHIGKVKLRAIHGHVVACEKLTILEVVKGNIVYNKTLNYPDNIEEINRVTSVFLGHAIDIRNSPY